MFLLSFSQFCKQLDSLIVGTASSNARISAYKPFRTSWIETFSIFFRGAKCGSSDCHSGFKVFSIEDDDKDMALPFSFPFLLWSPEASRDESMLRGLSLTHYYPKCTAHFEMPCVRFIIMHLPSWLRAMSEVSVSPHGRHSQSGMMSGRRRPHVGNRNTHPLQYKYIVKLGYLANTRTSWGVFPPHSMMNFQNNSVIMNSMKNLRRLSWIKHTAWTQSSSKRGNQKKVRNLTRHGHHPGDKTLLRCSGFVLSHSPSRPYDRMPHAFPTFLNLFGLQPR